MSGGLRCWGQLTIFTFQSLFFVISSNNTQLPIGCQNVNLPSYIAGPSVNCLSNFES